MGLKSNADETANNEYAYTTPNVNDNSEENDKTENYYETPDQKVGLLTENKKAGDTGYASLNSYAYDPYVKMDELAGDSKDYYVPMDSF